MLREVQEVWKQEPLWLMVVLGLVGKSGGGYPKPFEELSLRLSTW